LQKNIFLYLYLIYYVFHLIEKTLD